MWQKIIDEAKDRNFTVIAVALDTPEAARPWIEAARPTYPCLIDREHHVADLYGMVNVPDAVWIDETGHIVRPTENAGGYDAFRQMDRTTRQVPAAALAERDRVKSAYVEAVRDWALNGTASRHVLTPDEVLARLKTEDDGVAQAFVHFRLAQYLLKLGNSAEAAEHFAEASRLHPASWAIWRQAAEKDPSGLATGPGFWSRVDALGSKPYYRAVEAAQQALKSS